MAATSILTIGGCACVLHRWTPKAPPRAVVVLYHGLGAHALYPTVRYSAELLCEVRVCVVRPSSPQSQSSKPPQESAAPETHRHDNDLRP